MKTLRYYQQECLDALWSNLDRHVVASVPTGGGKSLVIAELCRRALTMYPGTRICVLTPRRELIEQNHAELLELWPEAPAGIFCAGLKQKNARDITVASIQSIYKHGPATTGAFDVIVVDESHLVPHGSDGTFHKFFAAHPEAKIAGLTATPYRLDGGYLHKGADRLFDDLVYECDVKKLIEQGYLCHIVARPGSKTADLSGVHTQQGEFKQDEMQERFMRSSVTEAACADALAKLADRKKILVFAAGVEHGNLIADALAKACPGTVEEIYGGTPSGERAEAVQRFRDGETRFLVNCGVFTTGFNVPDVDAIIMLRATKSAGLYVQCAGRGLRMAPGKLDCLLLDYGSNVERHGPIDDVSVTTMGKTEKLKAWMCPECATYNSYSSYICSHCGLKRERAERDIEAGLSSTSSTSSVVGREAETLEVHAVRYDPYTTKSGKEILRAIYSSRPSLFKYRDVKEYVTIGYDGFAGIKAGKWFARRGIATPGKSLSQLIDELHDAPRPKAITVVKEGKFDRILAYQF
jgi:DNA repair protein RadD